MRCDVVHSQQVNQRSAKALALGECDLSASLCYRTQGYSYKLDDKGLQPQSLVNGTVILVLTQATTH